MNSVTESMPVTAPESEQGVLRQMQAILQTDAIPMLVGSNGDQTPLSETVYQLLKQIIAQLSSGNAISVVPYAKYLTTQEAADILDISRAHLIKLLEQGEIPFTLVGTHRRIKFGNVMAYLQQRDEAELAALDRIAQISQEAGQY